MHTSVVNPEGQVTIPKEICDLMGLKPGDAIEFHILQNNNVFF